MKTYNEFPTSEPAFFNSYFNSKKNADNFAKEHQSKVENNTNGGGKYFVKYQSEMNRIRTSGREMYILFFTDTEMLLKKQIIKSVPSREEGSRYIIYGYEGKVFKNISTWNVDLYCEYGFENLPEVKELKARLEKAGKIEYAKHMLLSRPSLQYMKSLTGNEWTEAIENNYI